LSAKLIEISDICGSLMESLDSPKSTKQEIAVTGIVKFISF